MTTRKRLSDASAIREAEKRAEQLKKNAERIARVNRLLVDCDGGWHVLFAPPQKEQVVERLLGVCGFPAFVPIIYRWRRVNSRQHVRRFVPYVMASRYVFVGMRAGDPFPWARLLQLDLVGRPLMHAGRPVNIPPATMRGLFETSKEANDRKSAVRLNKSIAAGDDVVLLSGPFAGRVVKIAGIERGRARFLVEMFQTAQMVEADLGALEAV